MRAIMVGALFAVAMVANAHAAIKEEPVTYTDGETTMKGFVLYDDAIIVMVQMQAVFWPHGTDGLFFGPKVTLGREFSG